MSTILTLAKTADAATEKHVPVITLPAKVVANETFVVTAEVGAHVRHPNTAEHYISWIELFFQPGGSSVAVSLGKATFEAHADSAKGAGLGAAATEPFFSVKVNLKESGTLFALSYCNLHGLWSSEKAVTLA